MNDLTERMNDFFLIHFLDHSDSADISRVFIREQYRAWDDIIFIVRDKDAFVFVIENKRYEHLILNS
jgi:hypothetical protein